MEIVSDNLIINSRTIEDFVRANELHTMLKQYASRINVLSLDCFDTLLWRKTALPIDLFYDLQHYPAFKALNIAPAQRASAEMLARQIMFVRKGIYEVYLHDIYQLGFPHLNLDQVNALIEDELKAEMNTCYALPAMIELIRAAHSLNLKVIIVSSTYLAEEQLRKLLTHVLPEDVMNSINHIFCSCEFSRSKGGGLYEKVITKLDVPAHSILHIGDNFDGDLQAPRAVGIKALHFIQHDAKINEILRMQNIAASISIPDIHYNRAQSSPFRGILASSHLSNHQAESILGYVSLGPIMYAFARLICDDVAQMKREGKNPKVLFLMRDGYLPALACEALSGHSFGERARISRFTATAASFRSKDDVERFLGEYISTLPLDYICRQLLLPPETANHFIKIANSEKHPTFVLCKLVLQDSILADILKESALFRDRFKHYLQNVMDIQPGDTVIFADIGYAGTAQQLLAPILKEELNIEVLLGRYIMTLNVADWQSTRRGLIDPSWCDDKVMGMIGADVSLLEQFCCSGDDSVVDYEENGNPIFSKNFIHQEQISKIRRIQAECVRFIHEAKHFFQKSNCDISLDELKDNALIELARLLYLPTAEEIEFLKNFYHDKNKGYQETFRVYSDPTEELNQMQSQGLLFNNQHPHILRTAGIELSIAVMAQRRSGFSVNLDDRSLRQEWVTIIFTENNKHIQHTCNAFVTRDGYFALCLPIDMHHTQISIIFGKHYHALQIERIEAIKSHAFLSSSESQNSYDLLPQTVFNQMIGRGAKQLECSTINSATITNLPPREDRQIFRIVYRPITRRTD